MTHQKKDLEKNFLNDTHTSRMPIYIHYFAPSYSICCEISKIAPWTNWTIALTTVILILYFLSTNAITGRSEVNEAHDDSRDDLKYGKRARYDSENDSDEEENDEEDDEEEEEEEEERIIEKSKKNRDKSSKKSSSKKR